MTFMPFDPTVAIMFAACTLFAYDSLLNVGDEVFCFWSQPWRWGKIAYVGTRTICIVFVLVTFSSAINFLKILSRNSMGTGTSQEIFGAAQFTLIILVYVSCQAVLSSRVYALYGNKTKHLVGLITICCVLPVVVTVTETACGLAFNDPAALLYTYNVLGLLTDAALFRVVLILEHAFRSPSRLNFRFSGAGTRSAIPSTGKGAIVRRSSSALLSIMVSDSVIYYFTAVLMYTTTFILGALNIRVPILGVEHAAEDGIRVDVALLSMMTVLTGVLAPKLLLSVRKEFYGVEEEGGLALASTRV